MGLALRCITCQRALYTFDDLSGACGQLAFDLSGNRCVKADQIGVLDLRVRDAVVARQLGLNLADLVESGDDGRVGMQCVSASAMRVNFCGRFRRARIPFS